MEAHQNEIAIIESPNLNFVDGPSNMGLTKRRPKDNNWSTRVKWKSSLISYDWVSDYEFSLRKLREAFHLDKKRGILNNR